MSWTLLDQATAGFTDGGSGHVLTFPGGAASAGDLLVLAVSSDITVSTPPGWSAANSDVGNLGAYWFVTVAAGGETSVTITTAGTFATAAGFLRYSGAAASPLDQAGTGRSIVNGSTTPAAATGALATTGELALAAACLGGLQGGAQTGITWSTGYTNQLDVTSGGTGPGDQHLFVADNRNAGPGAESPSASWTGPTNNQTLLVVTFKPGAGLTGASPSGIAVPAAMGQPATGIPGTGPGGIAVPTALGQPAVSVLGAGPGGLAVPVAVGQPTVHILGVTPAGILVPVAVGTPGGRAAAQVRTAVAVWSTTGSITTRSTTGEVTRR